MIFIFFIFSLVGLSILFSLKIWEAETGKVLVSKKNFNKSDTFIEGVLRKFQKHYRFVLKKIFNLILLVKKIGIIIFVDLIKLKNIILEKFFGLVKIDEEMKLKRDKGSVSFFLRTMSEEKEKDRRE